MTTKTDNEHRKQLDLRMVIHLGNQMVTRVGDIVLVEDWANSIRAIRKKKYRDLDSSYGENRMKKVTVVIEKCVQISPEGFRIKRCSRNYDISSPVSEMLAWAESLGVKDATINDLLFCDCEE